MDATFWHQKWQSSQIGFHLPEINPLLTRYWQQVCQSSRAPVFVPLCGKSVDMSYLAGLGHNVIGCELSQLAVEQFFQEQQLPFHIAEMTTGLRCYQAESICLYQGDMFILDSDKTAMCSLFYDRAALIAWPEQMRQRYVRKLMEMVPAGARGLLITLDYPQDCLQGPPFAVSDAWLQQHLCDGFEITQLSCDDVLAANPRFVKRQVPWLTESAYLLVRR